MTFSSYIEVQILGVNVLIEWNAHRWQDDETPKDIRVTFCDEEWETTAIREHHELSVDERQAVDSAIDDEYSRLFDKQFEVRW